MNNHSNNVVSILCNGKKPIRGNLSTLKVNNTRYIDISHNCANRIYKLVLLGDYFKNIRGIRMLDLEEVLNSLINYRDFRDICFYA